MENSRAIAGNRGSVMRMAVRLQNAANARMGTMDKAFFMDAI
jgi:hypothetical protein